MKANIPRINPNSSIRSGYDFEDLYVLQLCINWLKDPEYYTELRIQYVPAGIKALRFAIDDIVTTRKGGLTEFHQLKHLQNPETDFWSFDRLLEKGLDNWINSCARLHDAGMAANGSLITNGIADPEVSACLTGEYLSFKRLESNSPGLLKRLTDTHGDSAIRLFCKDFRFIFDIPSRTTFEKQLRETLYYELKVTEAGVDRLLLHIAQQGSAKFPLVFTLGNIRDQLSWDDPRPLDQDFEVPADFEFFDVNQHAETVRDLHETTGGMKVFTGKPGSGKSTYLSKLYHLLSDDPDILVIRHHYHLNPKDVSFRDRLNADRVREALKAEFKKQKEGVLGKLAIQNTRDIPLKEFINKVASHYSDQDRTFVLIIDGLDHVIRENFDEGELAEFIEQVLYPQKGFWLLLGTQEMALPYLPNIVSRTVPQEKRIEVKGLGKTSITHIFEQHPVRKQVHRQENVADKIIPALYSKTQGNPLHLKYVLKQLELTRDIVSADSISEVLPYTGEISNYYEALWLQLPALSQTLALAITRLDFKLQEEQLFDLASRLTRIPHEISDAYRQIRHLVRIELSGISVYHNSFAVFISRRPELVQQQVLLYKQIRDWLKEPGNEDLAWAELLKIEYVLGNDEPILQVNKDWVIRSYLDCRDEERILNILALSAEAAFKKRLYGKVLYIRHLSAYFENKQYNFSKVLPALGAFAYSRKKKTSRRFLDYEKLSHFGLKQYLINLYDDGILRTIPTEAMQCFEDLMHNRNYELDEVLESLIEVLLHFGDLQFENIFPLLIHFRGINQSPNYFDLFLRLLLRSDENSLIGKLLKASLVPEEQNVVYNRLLMHHLITGNLTWHTEIDIYYKKKASDHWHDLYQFLNYGEIPKNLNLSKSSEFPESLDYHSTRSGKVNDLYTTNLFKGLFLVLSGSVETVNRWKEQSGERWPVMLMNTVLDNIINMGNDYQKKTAFSISRMIHSFDTLPDLDFYANSEVFEVKRTIIPHLFKTLMLTGAILNKALGLTSEYVSEDVTSLFNCKWLNEGTLHELIDSSRFGFSDSSYELYKTNVIDRLEHQVMPFNERAERCVALIEQAEHLGRMKEADEMLFKTASILISYGNHKDMTLGYVIENIQVCGQAGSTSTKGFLRQIAPYIYDIEEYTDGDETGSFIYTWAGLLAKHDPNLLFNLYFDTLEKRNYSLSESLFGDCLECLDLQDPTAFAAANTALSDGTHLSLTFLAKSNPSARSALDQVEEVFGPVDYTEDRDPQERYDPRPVEIDAKKMMAIHPSEMIGHYDDLGFENYSRKKYVQQNFLKEWSSVWLDVKGEDDKKVIAVLKILITRDFPHISEETLDRIYPLVISSDRSFAFDCLCWSYVNNSDWSDLSTNIESAKQKWAILKRDFPGKALEFVDQTIGSSRRNRDKQKFYYIPAPRITHFFTYFGMLEEAEKITRASIDLLPDLFPGLVRHQPDFVVNELEISSMDILLKRLEWLSPLVRERAAYFLAKMLSTDRNGDVHVKFFKWLSEVKLETFACYGFTILLKSLDSQNSATYDHINFHKVYPISFRCMVTDLFLVSISQKTGKDFFAPIPLVIVFSSRKDAMTEEKFFSNMDSYLTQYYRFTITEMQRKIRVPVWKIWYQFFIEKIESLDIKEKWDDSRYANSSGEIMIGRSPIISEVFKSSFFQLLDYLYDAKLISYFDFESNTKKNLPADVSLWRIRQETKPSWWPLFSKSVSPGPVDLLNVPMKDLIKVDKRYQLLSLKGAVNTVEGHYRSKRQAEIALVPFAYRLAGSRIPAARQIFEAMANARSCWISKGEGPADMGFFDNKMIHSGRELSGHKLLDMEITELVGTIVLDTGMIWQYYRMVHQPVLPNPLLTKGLTLNSNNDKIVYKDNSNQVICTAHDFAMGLHDTANHGDIIPSGNYLQIDGDYLKEQLNGLNLKLGYVYQLKVREKGNSHRTPAIEQSYFEMILE